MSEKKQPLKRFLAPVVCAALGVWMLVYWIQTAIYVKNEYVGFPLQDYWQTAVNLPRYASFDLKVFWEEHNEHRIIFPELMYMADDLLFGAHEYLPIVLSTLFQVATFTILGWLVWSEGKVSKSLRVASILIGGIVLGWPGMAYVFAYPFLVQWTIVQLAVCVALLTLIRGGLMVPIACGVIATYSSGHGMSIWPVLLLSGLLLRIGRKRLAAIAVAAAVTVPLYFYRLVPSADAKAHQFLHEPSWFFGFLASMLSMPFSADRRIMGLCLGPASVLLFLFACYLAFRKRILAEPLGVFLLGSSLYSFLTIVVCGMGRTLPTYWDYPTAKVARYLTVPVFYWAVLLVFVIWVLARAKTATWSWTAVIIAAFAMGYQLPKLNPWLERQFDVFARQQSVTVAMEAGVTCDNLIERDLYPVPSDIHSWNQILKQRRLSIYSSDYFRWVGRPLFELAPIGREKQMKGEVSEQFPFRCAMQVAGWLDGDYREVLLVNEKGIVAGLAQRLSAGLPLYLPNRWSKVIPLENWTGFVNYDIPSQTIQPYALSSDGHSTAPFGKPIPVPGPDKRNF